MTENNINSQTQDLKPINSSLFIIFAEFLGYVSEFIDWAEDLCDGKEIDEYKKQILRVDAWVIFQKMKTQYSIESIRKWYDEFYPLVLQEYGEKMKSTKLIF